MATEKNYNSYKFSTVSNTAHKSVTVWQWQYSDSNKHKL